MFNLTGFGCIVGERCSLTCLSFDCDRSLMFLSLLPSLSAARVGRLMCSILVTLFLRDPAGELTGDDLADRGL